MQKLVGVADVSPALHLPVGINGKNSVSKRDAISVCQNLKVGSISEKC